jgi:peptidoglycan-associated lipoprotein
VSPGPTRQIETQPPIVSSPGPITGSPIAATGSVETINDNSPLKPVFFQYDSDTLDEAARKALSENAAVLQTNSSWVVTVEGHCDERGTPEYNLALGDRRAMAAKSYLLSLGIGSERLKTVTYGKEFPFEPGHDEAAWSQNRRAHFMLTAK